MTLRLLLEERTAQNFQAAWYYSLLGFGVAVLVLAGAVLVQRLMRPMWRAGDRALAVIVAAVTVTAVIFLGAILVTVAVTLLPSAAGRG
jgi:hypothetical protein